MDRGNVLLIFITACIIKFLGAFEFFLNLIGMVSGNSKTGLRRIVDPFHFRFSVFPLKAYGDTVMVRKQRGKRWGVAAI